jgi:metallo-beta-lactamase class B
MVTRSRRALRVGARFGAIALATACLAAQDAPRVWTIQELFTRNVGTPASQDEQFPPHKIAGNLYYVGTTSLASFLIATPAGHILINSDYERNVPTIRDSVTKLGFAFEDVKILLGSHAHGDHMQGDAAVVELTHAKAMAMAEDVPALQAMRSPAGKPKVVYETLHDGSTVTVGGTTLTARLTPGHTPGCTTWTFTVMDGGRPLRVVIIGSIGVNPGTNLVGNPDLITQYQRSHAILKALPVDIPLGSHGAMFGLERKHATLAAAPGGPNPYIDPGGYATELAIQEAAFNAELDRQRREGPPPARGR